MSGATPIADTFDRMAQLGLGWLGLLTLAYAAYRLTVYIGTRVEQRLADARRELENEPAPRQLGTRFVPEEVMQRATRYYVRPDCQHRDPDDADDSASRLAHRESLFHQLDEFLKDDTERRPLVLLGGPGSGKTACLHNYYAKHQRQGDAVPLVLVPLGQPVQVVDRYLDSIKGKRDKVVLLDGLDADALAQRDEKARLAQLMDQCAKFRNIVISCRTHFFVSDEELADHTGNLHLSSHSGARLHKFSRLYLAPLNAAQVDSYLKRRFPYNILKRREALTLIANTPDASLRPMLLEHVQELLGANVPRGHVWDAWDIHEVLLQAWYRRQGWQLAEAHMAACEALALDMFERSEERGGEFMPPAGLSRFLADRNLSDEWVEGLTTHSLIQRDTEGDFRFAQRSFMEFLAAKLLAREPERWTQHRPGLSDFMKRCLMLRSNRLLRGDRHQWLHPPAELRGAVLAYATASWPIDQDLSGTILYGSELVGANLAGAKLSGADLRGANLTHARLERAMLGGASLAGANLRGAKLSEANLSGADLHGVQLRGANLRGAKLDNAELVGANLHEAELSDADLSEADLRGAQLTDAKLNGTDLREANLAEATLNSAELVRAVLSSANLSGAALSEADLSSANLSGANLSGADLHDALLVGASLYGAIVRNANLDDARLTNANLDVASLYLAHLSGADLSGATLEGADLSGATLDDACLKNAHLYGANLYCVILDGATLEGATLNHAKLDSTKLRNAALNGATFDRATYSARTTFPHDFDPEAQGMLPHEVSEKQSS